jgi:MscS family membrane protein
LLRLGAFSLEIEVSAYVWAKEWNEFLEIQEELLLCIMEIVQRAGAEIAFPSQTMYLAANPAQGSKGATHDFSTKFANESSQQIRISGQAGAGR